MISSHYFVLGDLPIVQILLVFAKQYGEKLALRFRER